MTAPSVIVGDVLKSQLPFFIVLILVVGYLAGRLGWLYWTTERTGSKGKVVRLDTAEKGNVVPWQDLVDYGLFALEKRAFFNRTWLFVAHRCRFNKPGDYHTFKIVDNPFFIVLGKDLKLRAFHNVCRHRAFTVVRKPCGTSTRFSCKYHGWQYDDQGHLVKAPQFDSIPEFDISANGLFEINLLETQDGFVFVNFDANSIGVPFQPVKSKVNMGPAKWVDGFRINTHVNWRFLAQEYSEAVQWNDSALGWLPRFQKPKHMSLLGPLTVLRELDNGFWSTMVILPLDTEKTDVWVDIYTREGTSAERKDLRRWKTALETESVDMLSGASGGAAIDFAYECGGRKIDLAAILAQHRRLEVCARKELQPATRRTGHSSEDIEAVAICEILDGRKNVSESTGCPKITEFGRRLEW